ncbi:hypothetical protein PIB30_034751, partial [Stylosanthes scabra]|nr:hypothetical protein [Stylosanthes scabra]
MHELEGYPIPTAHLIFSTSGCSPGKSICSIRDWNIQNTSPYVTREDLLDEVLIPVSIAQEKIFNSENVVSQQGGAGIRGQKEGVTVRKPGIRIHLYLGAITNLPAKLLFEDCSTLKDAPSTPR